MTLPPDLLGNIVSHLEGLNLLVDSQWHPRNNAIYPVESRLVPTLLSGMLLPLRLPLYPLEFT